MNAPDIFTVNEPWSGKWWVGPPQDYKRGLFRVHQIEAHHLLKRKVGLTNWSAYVLQVMRFQYDDLNNLQAHWLRKIEKESEVAHDRPL